MNYVLVILGYQMYVGILEIVVFLLGGVALGFFIHFFLVSRRTMSIKLPERELPVIADTAFNDADEWRLKYYEEMELQEKVRIEIGVSEPFVEPTVQTILRAASTGEVGDGKVFVLPVQAVYRIRTGEVNEAAVTPEIAPSEELE